MIFTPSSARALATAALFGTFGWVHGQSFTNGNANLPETFNSGGCVGFADLDGDGYDDLVILDQSRSLHTLYQSTDGTFTDYALGQRVGVQPVGDVCGRF